MASSKIYEINTFCIISLGCSKNQVDSEVMLYELTHAGLKNIDISKDPDLIIINTCGFIKDAKEESIQCILEASRDRKNSILMVAGCLSQLYKDRLKSEIPEIDILIGTNEFNQISLIIDDFINKDQGYFITDKPVSYDKYHLRSELYPHQLYRYLKIAEGCSRKCSFCVIPLIKDRYRSKPADIIMEEITALLAGPTYEFNLISQDTMYYGRDFDPPLSIIDLISRIDGIKGRFYCRLLYLHPNDISEDFIKAVRDSERFIDYFDIPVQHISDRMLKAMNRKETKKSIYEKIELIRSIIPSAVIRTTVMTGFPGESDEDFRELVRGIEDLEFDRLGCFVYSDEEYAPSYKIKEKISEKRARERFEEVMSIQQDIHYKRIKRHIGSIKKGIISPYEARLLIQAPEIDGELLLEDPVQEADGLCDILITGVTEYDYIGRVANDE